MITNRIQKARVYAVTSNTSEETTRKEDPEAYAETITAIRVGLVIIKWAYEKAHKKPQIASKVKVNVNVEL